MQNPGARGQEACLECSRSPHTVLFLYYPVVTGFSKGFRLVGQGVTTLHVTPRNLSRSFECYVCTYRLCPNQVIDNSTSTHNLTQTDPKRIIDYRWCPPLR
eukprot:1348754-Amorphochlora_amoeboformis.AAC.1